MFRAVSAKHNTRRRKCVRKRHCTINGITHRERSSSTLDTMPRARPTGRSVNTLVTTMRNGRYKQAQTRQRHEVEDSPIIVSKTRTRSPWRNGARWPHKQDACNLRLRGDSGYCPQRRRSNVEPQLHTRPNAQGGLGKRVPQRTNISNQASNQADIMQRITPHETSTSRQSM